MTTKEQFIKNTKKKLAIMPPIVQNFYSYRISSGMQPSTMYTTISNLHQFFDWYLTTSPTSEIEQIQDFTLESIAQITAEQIQEYITEMLSTPMQTTGKLIGKNTINTRIMTLRGFFRWLTVESTDPNNQPYSYLTYNPMAKIKFKVGEATLNAKANAINQKIFDGERKFDFLEWLRLEYKPSLSPQARKLFEQTEQRNYAIFSLLVASGLRVTELVNINLTDLDQENHLINHVVRKGDHEDVVKYAGWAEPYLQDWLIERQLRFGQDEHAALFLSTSRQQVYRISQSQVERMVKKLTKAYGRETTPHKLRHTFGTELYRATNSVVDVQQALGQTTDSATKIYIHADQQRRNQAIEELE
ncbi:tyrosine recombinase XerS [Weissella coleopterorum]|uniref:Tyrosine recombinase XerS n=1 Tax=Weissella coleopterorum TaxID=2714949 RepID=A0A6G8B0U9_9LACO|nr:tyrosine recombinase XerS [Weissella coleopterorum]QIL50753.1 tyrosine recombinase XerS [Weissella coleopterorum]